jgi:hypothetical protein
MEFPWSAIGAIFAAITLAVLLGYNIPKFVKQFSIPKINIDLFIYPEKTCKQKGVPQSDKPQIFDKEIEVLPNISPQFLVRINPKWKYTVSVIEVIGWSKSTIKRINLFSTQKRFWLEKEFTEIEGNYKVFPNITIRKGHTTDPLLLDLQIDPPFEKGEQRKMTVRVSTEESRKQLEKDFLIKASA